MAAPNTRNVAAAKPGIGGGVYRVPLGTALPTDADAPLSAAILAGALGYVSDAGIVPTRDTSVDKPKAWGGDIVAQLLTDESRSFAFTLLEVYSQAVQTFVHGTANVTATPATTTAGEKLSVVDKGGKPDQCVLVFEMKHGAKRRRVVVPMADPVVDSEEPWTDGGLSAYGINVEAIKDTSGARVYEYFSNDNVLVSA